MELNKLKAQSATQQNEKWSKMIKRENELYEAQSELRTEFERDYTRVIYSNAYKRMKHKTQVFFSPTSDHICTRSEHVSQVDSISYVIAKALGLNTELTRTIAVAHDLGHSPFGHKGEKILNKILMEDTEKSFWHEKNGLNCVENIELLENREGDKQNLNLTYAVRDGIISHCGEIDENSIKPREEYIELKKYTKPNEYSPYTWEGCVVKISDKISYLGRDIEDAVRFNIINQKDIDELYEIIKFDKTGYNILNNTNIIDYLTKDLIENTTLEKGLTFSAEALDIINNLKEYNYKRIYNNRRVKLADNYFEIVFRTVYDVLKEVYAEKIDKIEENISNKFYSEILEDFVYWLKNYCVEENFENKSTNNLNINYKIYDLRKKEDYFTAIVEYISGMTDNKVIDTYNSIIRF